MAPAPVPPGEAVRLLVSGDLHLGRSPSRAPTGDPTLAVEAVVRAMVEQAIARRVDAVVLTGDTVDAANKHFEAFGVLERTLRRLAEAGIPTVLVAGNHDHDVAGAVVEALGSPLVRLLGRGQTWEAAPIERDGREVARLVGWSFAGPAVEDDPLATFPAEAPDVPLVGVLHADLDRPGSPYAPVALADLWARPVTAWLLGHVHAPRAERRDGRLVLYPGSPQPLDPGERGAHGAWLVEVEADGSAEATLLPLATLVYDGVAVGVDGAASAEAVRSLVLDALREHTAEARRLNPALLRAIVRVRLTGRTAAYAAVQAAADELRADGEMDLGDLAVTVEACRNEARPALDLGRLAAGSGPVATLAGLALRLDGGTLSDADRRLVAQATEGVRAARQARAFEPLAQAGRLGDDPEAEAVGRLRQQVDRLLDAALAQRIG